MSTNMNPSIPSLWVTFCTTIKTTLRFLSINMNGVYHRYLLVFVRFQNCSELRNFAGPLSAVPNIIHTPHCSWYSDASCKELRLSAAREVRRAIVGRCPHDLSNCVNKEALLAGHTRRPTSSTSLAPNVSTSFNPLMPSFGTSIADGNFYV